MNRAHAERANAERANSDRAAMDPANSNQAGPDRRGDRNGADRLDGDRTNGDRSGGDRSDGDRIVSSDRIIESERAAGRPTAAVTAADAAMATSAASSEMADSFFAGEYDDLDSSSKTARRRILPNRRGAVRTQSSQPTRPVPMRPGGAHPDGADSTLTFEAPQRADVSATSNGGGAGGAADTHGSASRGPVVPRVSLPDANLSHQPINPTSIVSPVVGATSIVIKPSDAAQAGQPAQQGQQSQPGQQQSQPTRPVDTDPNGDDGSATRAKSGSGDAPLAGGPNDTVVFQRIDLVYVEDGDNNGAHK
jgi:hypothetical protein